MPKLKMTFAKEKKKKKEQDAEDADIREKRNKCSVSLNGLWLLYITT